VTIDGDIRNQFVETTLGFDTATKVYSQLVGNMATDCNSAKKYFYFIRLMGRAVSHITLESALQSHPNAVLLSEDIESKKLTLKDIISNLADLVNERALEGKNFGVVLVPEGTVHAIPELRSLVAEMNLLFKQGVHQDSIVNHLTPWSAAVLNYLPPLIRSQLFMERESSGAVQLSQISTEKLLAELVGEELAKRKSAGTFKGKFAPITHFFGYQARSSLPSNFDCAYGLALGATAGVLVAHCRSGYMATIRNLSAPVSEWVPVGIPFTAMMTIPVPGAAGQHMLEATDSSQIPTTASVEEITSLGSEDVDSNGKRRKLHRSSRPVIPSSPIDILGGPFMKLQSLLPAWRMQELYSNPGPIQFEGPTANDITLSLMNERHDYLPRILELRKLLDHVNRLCLPGVSESLLDAALTGVTSLSHILNVIKSRE
jgi:pyrophosphate--fructose-6-phosphate 1-phosphotransferase